MKLHAIALLTIASFGIAIQTAPAAAAEPERSQSVRAATPKMATVEFLFVEHGDAALVRSPEGHVALIDTGPTPNIVPLLRERGVSDIDLVVITHRHIDHYGGADDLLNAFRVKRFIDNGSPYRPIAYERLLKTIANQGISISAAAPAPETIRLGSIVLRILPRPPDVAGTAERASSGANENSRSLGVRVEYGSFSALITGDSQKDTHKWWQENIAPSLFANATILKLAHHGSVSGTDADWLGIVKPQAAVVSMGLDVIWQRWSMPAPSVTALLKERRIKLHNTALSGSIGIQTDGQSWQVFMGGRAPGRPPSPREVVFVGVQYAVACVYVGLIAWRCTKYRETWRRLVTNPIFSVGAGAIVLVLYGVLGSTFGLPDLFWHDEWAIQLLAGLSVMWLTLFLAALTADGWRETLATREQYDGPTRAGMPLVLMVLPAAMLPVFNSGAGHPLAAALDRSWLVAGMLVGLLVVRAAVEIVARRTALTTLSLGSRTTVAVVAAAVIVPIALALADRARPPAAVSICLLIALLGFASYLTRRRRSTGYIVVGTLLVWTVFTNGRDPYRLQVRGLDEYYADGAQVDLSYFRGRKDGLRGSSTLQTTATPDAITLLKDESLLPRWKAAAGAQTRFRSQKPLVVVSVSGGGIAASVWTALCLDRLIKTIPGFTGNVRVVTGASGGMVAAGYFVAALARPPLVATSDPSDDGDVDETEGRAGADAERKPAPLQFSAPVNPWLPQVDLVSDLANDVLTPVASHIALAGLPSLLWPGRAWVDRGSVLEAAWERNTHELLAKPFASLSTGESEGWRPSLIVTPTMVEEGRPLVVSNLDVESLDEIELFKLLPRAGRLPLSTVLRMNAAFPLVTPAAMLPTLPPTRVVDAGYVDNYGVTTAASWISANRDWLTSNVSGVVLIQSRAYPLTTADEQSAVMSYIGRSIQGTTTPLEGYTAAKKSAMIARNNSLVAALQESFQQDARDPHFFTSVVLESKEQAALSWSISRADRRRLSDELDSIENRLTFERIQTLLGAKGATIGKVAD